MSTPGILLSQMDAPPGREADFHDWYDTEHIPARLVIPGFTAASRYEAVEGAPRWLVIYELDDLTAFDRPEYRRLKTEPSERTRSMLATVGGFTRYTCDLRAEIGDPVDHDHVGVEAFSVQPEQRTDFESSESERCRALVAAGGRGRVLRYRVLEADGAPWTHLVVHEVAKPSVWAPPQTAHTWLYRSRSRQVSESERVRMR
ncbi:MAG: hypothetical protein ACRDOY_08405 [Nocardioidaceae bacterium]